MRLKLGVAPAAKRLRGKAPARPDRLHQVHNEGNRHLKPPRSSAARMPFLDKGDNALTQIKRIGLRHRESPPAESESRNPPNRNPSRFNLRIRRSSGIPRPPSPIVSKDGGRSPW